MNHSYRDISESIKNPEIENLYLNQQVVLNRMIVDLPQVPWANIEIQNWVNTDEKLPIEFQFYDTLFGEVLAANTSRGVCYLGVTEGKQESILVDFKKRFKHTDPIKTETSLQKQAIDFLDGKTDHFIQFHLKGTPYQTEIWRKLIRIPYGKLLSYSTLGGSTEYSRAAGAANSRNPIFWIIPCHRAVKVTGEFDHYFWSKNVKKRLLAWEFANSII